MLLLCLIILFSSLPMIAELSRFVIENWNASPSMDSIGEIQELIDGYGGILVAAGVFFEERETLRHLSKIKNVTIKEDSKLQSYLNLIAHHNGMGILLMGLFIEIGSQILEMPSRVVNTDGIEVYILALCMILCYFAIIIMLDFVKDFGKTYFINSNKLEEHDV